MAARERFVKTREAVMELAQVQALIMTDGDDWKPEGAHSSGISDPTANRAAYNVDTWQDKLIELRGRESELQAFIGLSLRIIESVREGLGDDYASILEQRYIDCYPWRWVTVGAKQVVKRTGIQKVNVAFDWIDSMGLTRILNGDTEI